MPTTYVDYTATAAQTDFAFSFDYLEDEHVVVEIDGSATTDFTLVTSPSTKVVLNSGATVGQKVRVRRKSQPDTNLVDFENGSVLTESELDRAYLHNRYLNEEIAELNDASLQKGVGSDDWDAKSQKLTNLADPTEAQDAATKNYVDTNDALKVNKAGDSMTGALVMGSNKITGLDAPTDTTDATTKTYVDNKVNQASTGTSFPPTKWVFTGTAGASTTYSVTGAEVNGDTAYDVSIDGAVKEPTTDFTVDPDTDTLTIIPTLSGGEDIVVIERGFGVAITTGTIGSSQIATGAVTYDKIQNVSANNVLLGNDNGTGQDVQELTAAEARALLDFDTEVANNTAVAANTAKVTNATHTGDVTGDTALTIADDAVTPAKLDDTQVYEAFGFTTNGQSFIAQSTAAGGVGIRFHKTNNASPDGQIDLFVDVNGSLQITAPQKVSTSDEELATLDNDGNLNITGVYKINGTTVTNGKYSTGWITSIPTAHSDVTYTHNLGTEDILYKVYVRDSSGFEHDITGGEAWAGVANANCNCVNITSTQITIRFFDSYLDWTTTSASTNPTERAWSTATHIKVVVQ